MTCLEVIHIHELLPQKRPSLTLQQSMNLGLYLACYAEKVKQAAPSPAQFTVLWVRCEAYRSVLKLEVLVWLLLCFELALCEMDLSDYTCGQLFTGTVIYCGGRVLRTIPYIFTPPFYFWRNRLSLEICHKNMDIFHLQGLMQKKRGYCGCSYY